MLISFAEGGWVREMGKFHVFCIRYDQLYRVFLFKRFLTSWVQGSCDPAVAVKIWQRKISTGFVQIYILSVKYSQLMGFPFTSFSNLKIMLIQCQVSVVVPACLYFSALYCFQCLFVCFFSLWIQSDTYIIEGC